MCGIVGVRRFDGAPVEIDLLRKMTALLAHRGPDDEGYWTGGDVGFGHRRLSVIDLGGSAQPMSSEDGYCHLTFNGEILNFRELRQRYRYPYKTDGDTETILAAYASQGSDSVRELAGQFAFGLYDSRDDSLWLARDRMGILPIYYYANRNFFAFASEVKALLPVIPSICIDTASLSSYLAQRAVPAPYTLFEGIRKLLPGSILRVDRHGHASPRRYWNLSSVQPMTITPNEAIERVADTLTEAVSSALIADVPVGAYLSGGVDSSLIVALIAKLRMGGGIKTFSAGFGDPRNDELPWARKVSALLNTDHHEINVDPEDFRTLWRKLTWHRDAPISEPSDIAVFRLAELARENVTVVLSGEGSDELFGGYPKHRYACATAKAGLVPGMIRLPALHALERSLPLGAARLRIAVRALGEMGETERFRGWFSPFTSIERGKLLGDSVQHAFESSIGEGERDPLWRMLACDLESWLPDNLLERGDRMSMATSLELRPPFLDRRVVELALALPSNVKVRNGTTKWIVKEVAKKLLPEEIVNRPKIGFRVPLDAWFREGLEDYTWSVLTSSASFTSNYFDRQVVRDLLSRHRRGRSNEENRIWTLLCLETWYETFFTERRERAS